MNIASLVHSIESVSGMRVRALARTAQDGYVVFLKEDKILVPAVVSTRSGLNIIYDRNALTPSKRAVLDSVVRELLTKDVLKTEGDIWTGELFGTRK